MADGFQQLIDDRHLSEIGCMKSGNLPAGSAETVPENAIEANITKAKCFGSELLRMRFLRKKPCKSVFPSHLRNSTVRRRTRRARAHVVASGFTKGVNSVVGYCLLRRMRHGM